MPMFPRRLVPPERSFFLFGPRGTGKTTWLGLDKPMPAEERLQVPYEDLVRDRFIAGTPDDCAPEIERYRARIGVNHFLLRLQWPGMPQRLALDQIELLGQHLFPTLRRPRV